MGVPAAAAGTEVVRVQDAVVVGAGPNGLAAAVAIAEQGFEVTVLEARDTIGGGTRTTTEALPGLLVDECSAVHPLGIASPFLSDLPGPIQRGVGRFAVHAGMIRAPRWARELTGHDRPAVLSHTLYEPVLQLDARMHRWAFGTPRYVLLARARAAGAPAPEVLTR